MASDSLLDLSHPWNKVGGVSEDCKTCPLAESIARGPSENPVALISEQHWKSWSSLGFAFGGDS